MDNASLRVGQIKRIQQRELRRLRKLSAKCAQSINDAHAPPLQVIEKSLRIENAIAVLAIPRRRAHPVDDQGEAILRMLLNGVSMAGRIDLHVGRATTVKFGKQRLEPVLLLVINRNRFGHKSFAALSIPFYPIALEGAIHGAAAAGQIEPT